MEKTIYDLELHESMSVISTSAELSAPTCWQVMRVPGGFLYTLWDTEKKDYVLSTVFVPFSNEFNACEFNYPYDLPF